jgi:tRNA modification GTPase
MSAAATIYALSSGRPPAALAVIRISGPRARRVIEAMAGRVPEPRRAILTRLTDPRGDDVLDTGLALWFPGPNSETGEDLAELHLHGGHAVIAGVLKALSEFDGCRLAEPGEFTRRAFENGKLDLTEVEGLADLVGAETEAQRRQALRQMRGVLRRQAESWRAALLEASALIAAEIDFSDEGDVAQRARFDLRQKIAPVLAGLQAELAKGRAGERLRDGLTVVIAGPPNVGKSSLINVLARREAAITSAIPGTTRDAIEVHLDVGGCPLTLIDTAGLRETRDAIETIGVERARERAGNADLVLWLSEQRAPLPPPVFAGSAPVYRILTKSDLGGPPADGDAIALSATSGANIDRLLAALADFTRNETAAGETSLITRARHRRAMEIAQAALTRAENNRHAPIEILAEDLRAAIHALESLIGKVDVEDVLGEIFSRFCIGK